MTQPSTTARTVNDLAIDDIVVLADGRQVTVASKVPSLPSGGTPGGTVVTFSDGSFMLVDATVPFAVMARAPNQDVQQPVTTTASRAELAALRALTRAQATPAQVTAARGLLQRISASVQGG